MAATYKYIIQDASTSEYLTTSSTWSPNVADSQTYDTAVDAKTKIDTLGSGYYVVRYVGIVS